jgi:hypothetical protein
VLRLGFVAVRSRARILPAQRDLSPAVFYSLAGLQERGHPLDVLALGLLGDLVCVGTGRISACGSYAYRSIQFR